MSRFPLLTVSLVASAALLCAGCELPQGPLRWDPLHLKILPRGDFLSHGPFHLADDCYECCPPECTGEPEATAAPQHANEPRGPRLTQHHQAVPLAGPGVNAPWPKFHPVPTRPVFEPQCLPPPEPMPPQLLPQ